MYSATKSCPKELRGHSVPTNAAGVRRNPWRLPMHRISTVLGLATALLCGASIPANALDASPPSSINMVLTSGLVCDDVAGVEATINTMNPGPPVFAPSCGAVKPGAEIPVIMTPVEPFDGVVVVKFTAPDGSVQYGCAISWPPPNYVPADAGQNI